MFLALALAALAVSCRRESPGAGSAPPPQPAQFSQMAPEERSSFLLNRGIRFLADGQNSEAVKVLVLAKLTFPLSHELAMSAPTSTVPLGTVSADERR